ncbi:dTDP-4-dehydrorhamnose 3,5-epimerase related protein [Magnetococcus marinus MC-1]|uniref:dTDP-4-dehydrorhamnose 3,5-epimerase n=1 Tax=Magnetococcus marinus (strain ATCC BAA-1437 / JCM 17883 / MC-1) TaxID=156889 RepID=A0LDD2_MAGMM|nr:dTDP-4-dehydrorhamnose 3,5-epimerase family protein [Magnetococcus marinus]ABK45975.1 dTDP-4-dehydrorhamnose 3,5-epimerase related protein [Magnetococcus marinus MC-1]
MSQHATPIAGLLLTNGAVAAPGAPQSLFETTPFIQSDTQLQLWREPQARTLRGLRVQQAPAAQTLLLTPLTGMVWIMVLDLRRNSHSFCHWYGVEMQASAAQSLCIPPGCAHGFLTLAADTLLLSMASVKDEPLLQRGIRWDDAQFGMAWPYPPEQLSDLDGGLPDFPLAHL